jgi:S1-C subfamily serine protease
VAVRSVIAGSAAEAAGILPGDRVLRYAGDRVFGGEALRAATRAGDPGATIPVELERDGSTLLLYLPRGPIGIRMGFVRERP